MDSGYGRCGTRGITINIDDPFEDGVHAYRVVGPEGRGRVLLWYDGDALVGALHDGIDYTGDVEEAECSDPRIELAAEAVRLPRLISSHEMFDMDVEIGRIPGESNRDCYDEIVKSFLDRVDGLVSQMDRAVALDLACRACEENTSFDASYAVGLIAERSRQVGWVLDDAFLEYILDGRRSSGGWILDSLPDESLEKVAGIVFGDGSRSSKAMAVLGAILDRISGSGTLPDTLLSECDDFFAASNGVHILASLGMNELALRVVNALKDSPLSESRSLDTARLCRSFGVEARGLFVKAFLEEPSQSRLEEAASEGEDKGRLIQEAWTSRRWTDARSLAFFARNGLSKEVSDLVESADPEGMYESVKGDIDAMFYLAEVLLDEGHPRASAYICRPMLEYGKRSRDSFGSVARVMWLMDDICDSSGCPGWVLDYCRQYGRYWKTDAIWDAYGDPRNRHFRSRTPNAPNTESSRVLEVRHPALDSMTSSLSSTDFLTISSTFMPLSLKKSSGS